MSRRPQPPGELTKFVVPVNNIPRPAATAIHEPRGRAGGIEGGLVFALERAGL